MARLRQRPVFRFPFTSAHTALLREQRPVFRFPFTSTHTALLREHITTDNRPIGVSTSLRLHPHCSSTRNRQQADRCFDFASPPPTLLFYEKQTTGRPVFRLPFASTHTALLRETDNRPTGVSTSLCLHLFYENMSSPSQIRPRMPAHPAATRSPSSKKKNLDEATPIDKRRVAALGKMTCPNSSPRVRGDQSSQQDAVKQKDELKTEINCIRTELQQVRDDRDHLLAQVQSLTMVAAEFKEISGKSSKSLETMTEMAVVIEETCSSQSAEIKLLRQQIASSNEKLKVSNTQVQNLTVVIVECKEISGKSSKLFETMTDMATVIEETCSSQSAEIKLLRQQLTSSNEKLKVSNAQVQNLTVVVAECKEISGNSSKLLETMTEMAAAVLESQETCSSQSAEVKLLRQQLASSNEKLKRADLTTIEVITEYEEQKKTVIDLQNRLANAELQIVEAEKIRKKLHNTILELKGNIRVFCRVRPLLHDTELGNTEGSVVSYPTSIESLGSGIDLTNNAQMYSFTFDKVFNEEASQGEVFEEISQLIQSALDGYKVCIFAYGQTDSGKTYTMMGNSECPEQKGLIPRSLEQIFQISQSLQSQGWKYKMQASMLEIYNETIRDLLSPGRPTSVDTSGCLTKQYSIKHDTNGNTVVSDLTIIDVYSSEQVSFLLQQASLNRSVGKTQMNEQSCRSHFVFTLQIVGVNERIEQQIEGLLNLIDLAGSERLAKSSCTGDGLKETRIKNSYFLYSC